MVFGMGLLNGVPPLYRVTRFELVKAGIWGVKVRRQRRRQAWEKGRRWNRTASFVGYGISNGMVLSEQHKTSSISNALASNAPACGLPRGLMIL